MLADMLLDMKRPQEALAEYETSLRTDPNRFNGLYGAARTAELSGDLTKAKAFYAKVVELGSQADTGRPELAAARAFLAKH